MRARIRGAERISDLCRKSRAHCSRSVAISAQLRASPRLKNQSALHMGDDADGVNEAGWGIENVLPLADAASCCDI